MSALARWAAASPVAAYLRVLAGVGAAAALQAGGGHFDLGKWQTYAAAAAGAVLPVALRSLNPADTLRIIPAPAAPPPAVEAPPAAARLAPGRAHVAVTPSHDPDDLGPPVPGAVRPAKPAPPQPKAASVDPFKPKGAP